MDQPLQFTLFGKCIIAGEHSVLRGSPAIIFPIKTCPLHLAFEPRADWLHVEFHGQHSDQMHLLFWGALERALELLDRPRSALTGHIRLENRIAVGAGMGSSAVVCVAVAKLLQHWQWLQAEELFTFAQTLENLFHGQSSGADVAVVLQQQPIIFQQQHFSALNLHWQPKLYLSPSGQVSMTTECIKKVKTLWQNNPELAEKIDDDMEQAVNTIQHVLTQLATADAKDLLIQSMLTAQSCFKRWGLADGKVAHHMQTLQKHGALACKPTGAGDGGYVLSLWADQPAASLPFEMIALM
jgi:mevalonate kinase